MGWTLSPPRTAVSVWLTLPTPAPISQIYLEDTTARGSPASETVARYARRRIGSALLTRDRGQPGRRHPSRRPPPQPSAASTHPPPSPPGLLVPAPLRLSL